jgi:hypothetical protein
MEELLWLLVAVTVFSLSKSGRREVNSVQVGLIVFGLLKVALASYLAFSRLLFVNLGISVSTVYSGTVSAVDLSIYLRRSQISRLVLSD